VNAIYSPSKMTGTEDADNVYLQEFRGQRRGGPSLAASYEHWLRTGTEATAFDRRVACVRRYAFGVPNGAALAAIERCAPIVELGAGTGYWAYLLRNRGVEVVAFDLAPPDQAPNAYRFEPRTWTEVKTGGVEILDQYPDPTLLLCWPGYKDAFADEALRAYSGQVLIYIGEPAGGHTANPAFFERLRNEWVLSEQVAIPQWPGAHDALSIFHRGQRG